MMERRWSDGERAAGARVGALWHEFFRAQGASLTTGAVARCAAAAEAQVRHEPDLLALANVVGVATSLKVTAAGPTDQWSVTVYVERKLPEAQLTPESLVPTELDGVATDVVEVGRVVPLAFTERVRPALPGYSIGHPDVTAGTFGCLVHDLRGDGGQLLLSNNHVIAANNAASPGDVILQPGPADGGADPTDGIAVLERFAPIVFGESRYNLVDAAVARPTRFSNVVSAIIGQQTPTGVSEARIGGEVTKAGRTTGVTTGEVLAVNATMAVDFGAQGSAEFRHQIVTTAMSEGGDSGSLLVDDEFRAVGLLFAGSPMVTLHNHIGNVSAALGVRPVTAS
jgi:hypothetical protein